MKKRRFFSLCLAIVLGLTLSTPVFAVQDNIANQSTTIPSDTEVQVYALNFMTTSQDNPDLEINGFTHLYHESGHLSGYYITFADGSSPAGYTLLSLLADGSPIVEFSFDGTGPLDIAPNLNNLDTTLIQSVVPSVSITDNDERIIYNGPGELYLPTSDNLYYSIYSQSTVSFEDRVSPATSVNLYNGIIDWGDANINNSSVFKIKDFGSGTDYWLMSQFSSGNVCYPTAATNVLWYWGNMRNKSFVMDNVSAYSTNLAKASAIYSSLARFMGTDPSTGTLDMKIYAGYAGFFGETPSSGNWNYKKLPYGTTFNSYKTDLNGNCPIQVLLHPTDSATDNNGHSVMAFGYATSTTGTPYLFVMDGWNNYGRFVKFNYYPNFIGYKIWVA